MKDKHTQMWVPLYVDKWIFGSTRVELDPAERGVFIDLMVLAAKDGGFIRANETTPYLPCQIAGLLNIPEELLSSTISKCIKFDKLTEPTQGIYQFCKWGDYQFTDRYKRMVVENTGPVPKKRNSSSEKGETIRQDRIEQDKKEEGEGKPTPPILSAVREMAEAEHITADPDKFFHYHESKADWVSISDWKASFRYWARSEYAKPPVKAVTVHNAWEPSADMVKADKERNFYADAYNGGKCKFCGAKVSGLDFCGCSGIKKALAAIKA